MDEDVDFSGQACLQRIDAAARMAPREDERTLE
jgi:hypothetical protein